jgi:hypothetical protein
MILLLLIYLALPFVLVALIYLSGIRAKRVFIAIPTVFLALPVMVIGGLYLLRIPIQEGKVLPGVAPLVGLVFPADDLYEPLATTDLTGDRSEYTLSFSHKYIGLHAIEISSPKEFMPEDENRNLNISLKVFEGDRIIYEAGNAKGSKFRGRDDYGLHFVGYRVPEVLPVARELTAKVVISGDLEEFIVERKAASLSVVKMSDE